MNIEHDNPICRIPVDWLIKSYKKKFSISIEKYVPDNLKFLELFEDSQTSILHFQPSVIGCERFYDQLSVHEWYYQKEKSEFKTASLITRGKSVCEVGCGFGEFKHFCAASKYTGIDLNKKAVEIAKAKGINAKNSTVSEHLREVGAGAYDVVCAFQVLEHVVLPDLFLEELTKLLAPRGKLILSVPNDESFIGYRPNNLLNMPPHHQTRWTAKALTRIEERHNLRTLAVVSEALDPIHYRMAQFAVTGAVRGFSGKAFLERIYLSELQYIIYRLRRRINHLFIGNSLDHFLRTTLRGHTITGIYERGI